MNDWRVLVNPMQLGQETLWLVLPLCLAVAIVYKTVRVRRLGELPLQVVGLCAYMLMGLVVLGMALYLLLEYAA